MSWGKSLNAWPKEVERINMIRPVWKIGAFLILATFIGASSSADTLDAERARELLAGKPGWTDVTPLLRQSWKIPRVDPILKGARIGFVPPRQKIAAPPPSRDFWIINLEDFGTPDFDMNEDKELVYANHERTTSTAYLYIEDGLSFESSLLDDLMDAWEIDIYPGVTGIWGPPPDELDADPHIYLLIAEFPGADLFGGTVVGYFDEANEYTDPESISLGGGHSNEIEMLYINKDAIADPFGDVTEMALEILAHEFQHVIHWGLDSDEDLWLNEGHSDMAMVASGHGGEALGQHTLYFSIVPTTGLLNWDNRLADYGATAYFFIYLNEHYGGDDAITAIANDEVNGVTAVDNHLRINYGTNIRKVFEDWTIANLLDEATGPYSYGSTDSPRDWVDFLDSLGVWPPPYFFTWRDVAFNQPSNPDYPYLEDWSGEYFLLKRQPAEASQEFHIAFDGENGKPFYPSVVGLDPSDMVRTSLNQFVLNNNYAGDYNIPLSEDRICVILRHAAADTVLYATSTADYDFRSLSGNGTQVTDGGPPGTITDATAERIDGTRIDLAWMVPGDDGFSGIAYYYDIRASTTAPITDVNWSSAYPVRNVPLPGQALSTDRCVLTDLLPDQDYWFGIKTYDEVDNESALSNVVAAHTGFPDLTPPARINTLVCLGVADGMITFRWTAPGDDGHTGTADRYELRYAPFSINDSNFRNAYIYPHMPKPSSGGTEEQLTVHMDTIPLSYAVAIRTFDEAGNVSSFSNLAWGAAKTGVDAWQLMGGEEPR